MKRAVFLTWSLLVAAGPLPGENPGYQPDPTWRAPAGAAARENPLALKPQARAGGRKLFLRHCSPCHGSDGSGIEKKHSADFELPVVEEQSDGSLFWKITNGNAGRSMPSFSKLPEFERWQIVLYIRTLKPSPPGQYRLRLIGCSSRLPRLGFDSDPHFIEGPINKSE